MRAEGGTDVWARTHFGFEAFSGHALQVPMPSGTVAEIAVSAGLDARYDQLGLLMSSGPTNWVKLMLERIGERLKVTCVVTEGVSDAALCPFPHRKAEAVLRLALHPDAVVAGWRAAGRSRFETIRLCPVPGNGPFRVGPMSCAPRSGGFEARFSRFTMQALVPGEIDA